MKAFKDPSALDNASRLIFQFNRIPRLNQRMECHDIGFTWESHAETALRKVGTLTKSLGEMNNSKGSFEKILSMILSIGNYINGDTTRGQVSILKVLC